MRVGLALGGGGARGFAHIGVLEVLEAEKIPVDIVSGTSMGSLIGALYAYRKDPAYVRQRIDEILNDKDVQDIEENFARATRMEVDSHGRFGRAVKRIKELYLWNMRVLKQSFVDNKSFERIFCFLLEERNFEECVLPFVAVATDMLKGEVVYMDSGSLCKAVLASSALPGVFAPRRDGDRILVDGGVLESVPVEALYGRAEFIVGISAEPRVLQARVDNSVSIMLSSDEIRYSKLVKDSLLKADFVIEPELDDYSWADFSKIDDIIEAGRDEAAVKIKELRKALNRKKYFPFLGKKPPVIKQG